MNPARLFHLLPPQAARELTRGAGSWSPGSLESEGFVHLSFAHQLSGTLAVHFSKYRGTPLCEVIYAQAKYVRKPKGLPPGRVQVSQTRSLGIRLDAERLERLLGSTENT